MDGTWIHEASQTKWKEGIDKLLARFGPDDKYGHARMVESGFGAVKFYM